MAARASYSKTYLVESEGLRKLREQLNEQQGYLVRDVEKNIVVDGVVGKLTLEADRRAQACGKDKSPIALLSLIWSLAVPLAIIGGLSRFS